VTRVLSAVLLLPVVFLLTRHLPPLAFLALVAAVAVIAALEYSRLVARRGFAVSPLAAAAGTLVLVVGAFDARVGLAPAVALVVVALPIAALARPEAPPEKFGNLALLIAGVTLLGVPLGHLAGLRVIEAGQGHDLPFLLLLVVWSSDTGAYYGGRLLGRRRLAPQLSPAKTVEGFVVGVVAAIAAAFLARVWFMHRLAIADCLLLAPLLAAVGAAGDLIESALKRWTGAKDSSGLIPGHGGMLDRIDSLLLAAPVLFYYHRYFMTVAQR